MNVKDTNPLQRKDECFSKLGEAKYFTALDACSVQLKMNLLKEDIHKTEFS